MYRKPSKRKQLIRRVILLSFMVITVLFIVTCSILFMLGFRLDGGRGIEQGALVQFDSRPTDASISIDGLTITTSTPGKRTLISGVHTFLMQKDGYNPWIKTLNLEPGTLTWLDYIRLVPENPDKQTVRTYKTVTDVDTSADMQAIAIQTKTSSPDLDIIDIRDREVRSKTITIPASAYTGASDIKVTHRFSVETWDEDGRYLLVKHTAQRTTDWLVVDTENVTETVNISELFNLSLTDVQFSGTSGDILFGLSGGVIRKLDLGSATVSRVLISDVSSFSIFDNNILTYVGQGEEMPLVGMYRDGDRAPRVLYTAKDADAKLAIATSRHYNDTYIAIADNQNVTVYDGSYPSQVQNLTDTMTVVETFSVSGALDQLSFSPEGDYLMARTGKDFSTYEVEYDRLNQAAIETSEDGSHPLQWLDIAHLWTVYDGHLSMRDFDGTNVQVIMPMEYGFDATLSQNGRYIYGVNKTDDVYRLERVILLPD